jgi:multidrug resistance efflux pump
MEQEHNTQKQVGKKPSIFANPLMQSITGIFIIALALGTVLFWRSSSSKIKIDKSEITAPVIGISPTTSGVLSEVYVRPGDRVAANTPLAKVGAAVLTAKVSGIVTDVANNPGATFSPGQSVVSMIDPTEFRVVGTIDENKGLSKIVAGQSASFTVDAFGGEEFTGVVDRIAPAANESAVTFSISDKRETKTFDVYVRFDVAAHPEFKNGMSARLTVYTR